MPQTGRRDGGDGPPGPVLSCRRAAYSSSSGQAGLPWAYRPGSGRMLRRRPRRPRTRPPYRQVWHRRRPVRKRSRPYWVSRTTTKAVENVSFWLPCEGELLSDRFNAAYLNSRKPFMKSRFLPQKVDLGPSHSRVDSKARSRILKVVRPSSSVGQSIGLLIRGSQVRILPGVCLNSLSIDFPSTNDSDLLAYQHVYLQIHRSGKPVTSGTKTLPMDK